MTQEHMQPKLWNKNFTIITLGTIVSMLGNALCGFAIRLMVLDFEDSIFLYTVFLVAYNLPKIVMPLLAGPYLDNFSRRKVIYTLDFISAGLFFGFYFILHYNIFNYALLLLFAVVIGSIDSVYQVAYDSLYPLLVDKQFYRKAYSISSMIFPISAVMVPVAAFIYEKLGSMEPIFLFNAGTFLLAAIMETQIRADETYISEKKERFSLKKYSDDFRFGLNYIKSEKGLLAVTIYFFITMLCTGESVLILPYFKDEPTLGVLWYTFVMGCAVVGRVVGGFLHYKFKYPANKKFFIAVCVYLTISVIEGSYIFVPIWLMSVLLFISGMFSVTSYNIRITATQSYVPDTVRGRFNGCFSMMLTLGGIIGQLTAGALAEVVPTYVIIPGMMAIHLAAVLAVMLPNRKPVSQLYNVDI